MAPTVSSSGGRTRVRPSLGAALPPPARATGRPARLLAAARLLTRLPISTLLGALALGWVVLAGGQTGPGAATTDTAAAGIPSVRLAAVTTPTATTPTVTTPTVTAPAVTPRGVATAVLRRAVATVRPEPTRTVASSTAPGNVRPVAEFGGFGGGDGSCSDSDSCGGGSARGWHGGFPDPNSALSGSALSESAVTDPVDYSGSSTGSWSLHRLDGGSGGSSAPSESDPGLATVLARLGEMATQLRQLVSTMAQGSTGATSGQPDTGQSGATTGQSGAASTATDQSGGSPAVAEPTEQSAASPVTSRQPTDAAATTAAPTTTPTSAAAASGVVSDPATTSEAADEDVAGGAGTRVHAGDPSQADPGLGGHSALTDNTGSGLSPAVVQAIRQVVTEALGDPDGSGTGGVLGQLMAALSGGTGASGLGGSGGGSGGGGGRITSPQRASGETATDAGTGAQGHAARMDWRHAAHGDSGGDPSGGSAGSDDPDPASARTPLTDQTATPERPATTEQTGAATLTDDGMAVPTSDGATLTISPVTSDPNAEVTPDLPHGRYLIQAQNAAAPTDYAFHLGLPQGAHAEVNQTGGVDVLDADGQMIQSLATPWAKDAAGKPVATSFTISGDTLIQHIKPSADSLYPILADPDTTGSQQADGTKTSTADQQTQAAANKTAAAASSKPESSNQEVHDAKVAGGAKPAPKPAPKPADSGGTTAAKTDDNTGHGAARKTTDGDDQGTSTGGKSDLQAAGGADNVGFGADTANQGGKPSGEDPAHPAAAPTSAKTAATGGDSTESTASTGSPATEAPPLSTPGQVLTDGVPISDSGSGTPPLSSPAQILDPTDPSVTPAKVMDGKAGPSASTSPAQVRQVDDGTANPPTPGSSADMRITDENAATPPTPDSPAAVRVVDDANGGPLGGYHPSGASSAADPWSIGIDAVARTPGIVGDWVRGGKAVVGLFTKSVEDGNFATNDPVARVIDTGNRWGKAANGDFSAVLNDYTSDPGKALAEDSAGNGLLPPAALSLIGTVAGGVVKGAIGTTSRWAPVVDPTYGAVLTASGQDPYAKLTRDYSTNFGGALTEDISTLLNFVPVAGIFGKLGGAAKSVDVTEGIVTATENAATPEVTPDASESAPAAVEDPSPAPALTEADIPAILGKIARVNPRSPGDPAFSFTEPNRFMNCRACSLQVDQILGGGPVREAPISTAGPIGWLESETGRKFGSPESFSGVVSDLLKAGPGARGIISGTRAGAAPGHVFNAINIGGKVWLFDGQSGGFANPEGYLHFALMRTN